MQQPVAVPAAPPDSQILELLAAGQPARAFEQVLDHFEARVYRLCCALLRDRALAEDVAQEALIRIWKALPRFDGRAALSTWIYAITRNRCLTALQRRRELASLSDPEVELEVEAAIATGPPDQAESPSALRDLVDALPERYRQAVTLYYYEERSVAETARLLGLAEGTVKTNLFRARGLLLERLRAAGMEDIDAWLTVTT